MRVLVVHNKYRSTQPSGENRVVDQDVRSLRTAGVEVRTLTRDSDTIDGPAARLRAAAGPVYVHDAVSEVARAIDTFRPDVMHVHNVVPLVSPWVVRTAHRRGVPVVQTVHNFRHSCLAGTHLRDGMPCTLCVGKSFPAPGVRYACYRGSRAQSLATATGALVHRGTWGLVARFLALTQLHATQLAATGLDATRIAVKPNSVADPGEPQPLGDDVLFLGRLSPEKGVHLLLAAWTLARPNARLVVAGDGPQREQVTAAAARDPSIVYVGPLDSTGVARAMTSARIVVVPSLWDTFPLVALESLARGRPVLATCVGGLPDIVRDDTGWLAEPDAESLSVRLTEALTDPCLASRSEAARGAYLTRYHPNVVTAELLRHYREVAGGHMERAR